MVGEDTLDTNYSGGGIFLSQIWCSSASGVVVESREAWNTLVGFHYWRKKNCPSNLHHRGILTSKKSVHMVCATFCNDIKDVEVLQVNEQTYCILSPAS